MVGAILADTLVAGLQGLLVLLQIEDFFLGIIKVLSTSDQQGHRGGWHCHELISLTQHISTYDYYKKKLFGN